MPKPKPLIAGNWKMNGLRDGATALLGALLARAAKGAKCDVLVCPPATLLGHASERLAGSSIRLGAQDCHVGDAGAHTGDISAAMLICDPTLFDAYPWFV
jgi:triosephosphate isomerase